MNTKTGRKRGLVLTAIRKLAARRKRFTIDDLCPPLTPVQAGNNCLYLKYKGELKCVKRAVRVTFNHKIRSVYERANLRPAQLTNKHL